MGEFALIKRNGDIIPLNTRKPFCTVKSAQQNISLMGDDTVSLNIISTQVITFDKGDKILVGGDEYAIRTTVNREEISDDYYSYEPVFYGVMYELMKSLYRNAWLDDNGKVKSDKSVFDLTYTIRDFVKVIIYNMERDYPGLWKFDAGNCPDTEAITINFSRQNCLQVLQTLCGKDNFNLDFKITQNGGVRTIHIGKFGTKITPPGGSDFFEWGKGNGLYKLKEEKIDDKTIKTRLWVEGGSTNIRRDYRDYAGKLQLPFPQRLNKRDHTLRDGTVVKAGSELIGISDDTKRFFEDAELAARLGSDEDAEEYDKIYPQRTGEVTALVYDDNKNLDVNSFIDETMNFDLNAKDSSGTTYLIDDTSAKITFISGKLAGQAFEVKEKGYNHALKKFTIIPFTDERGLTTPTPDNEAFQMQIGDKYKITDINLPKEYEDDAEEDLWYEGMQDFNDIRQARAKYTLTLDRMYFLENTPRDSTVCIFQVGDYVPVRDTRFGIEKSIRITKVQRNLLLDQDYAITLSDTNTINVLTQTVIEVQNHENIINVNRLRDLAKARRGWRTTEELRNMVYDTDGYFDPENIKPNSIDTNMLTVGSKSQQFILTGAILEANVNGQPNRFRASACILSHLTILEDGIRNWNITAANFILSDNNGYYLFAKCPKDGDNGTWFLTQDKLTAEPVSDPNNYYFQVGILGSLHSDDNFRDFVTTYGFTRINGNTITTGRIVTSDGECYLDLDGNKFRIGDATSSIDWNVSRNKAITLKNVSVVSESGDVSPLGVYRGVWNVKYTYYLNDEVSYTNLKTGAISTYRYINPKPSAGNVPTNSVYWGIVAKGADGRNGTTYYTWIKYADDASGNGMSDSPSGKAYIGFAYNKTTPTESNTPGDYSWTLFKGTDGTNGINGQPGEDGKTYYTWIKYSDVANPTFSSQIYDTPRSTTEYIGIAVNQITITESTDPSKYTWSKFKGDQGVPGTPGADGANGTNGTDGKNGDFTEYRYAVNGSKTSPPVLTVISREPNGWSTAMPTVSSLKYLWLTTAKISGQTNSLLSNWTTPIRVTPYDGTDGKNGEVGPALIFRGEYDDSKTYYGNANRIDAVKYNNHYYVARIDAGSFSGTLPTNTGKWNDFGSEFETVATNLLLAEGANIAGWIFRDGKLYSQNGDFFLNGATGEFGGIIRSSLFYGNSKTITESASGNTLYEIKPGIDYAQWYLINEPNRKIYILLPKAKDWDGLELTFFIKQSYWQYDVNTTHIKTQNGEYMYCKQNIYNFHATDNSNRYISVEYFNANYKGDNSSYWMMQPNMPIRFKSILGAWYCIDGLWTGE